MVAIVEFKSLKKLEGAEKGNYLSNLNIAASIASSNIEEATIPLPLISQLTSILREADCAEIDLTNGLPSAMSVLRIDQIGKNVNKEMQDLKSRVSTDVKDESKSLEQLIVERIKSKIYSFDTLAAEEMSSEDAQFYEILNPEFTMRDRLLLLKAILSNPFSLKTQVKIDYFMAGAGYYRHNCIITGLDPKENRFTGYKLIMNTYDKGHKRIINFNKDNTAALFRHEEELKKHFSTGDLSQMYREFSDIKHMWLERVVKSDFGPYSDKNTGEVVGLALPEDVFQGNPDAYVLNVSCESINTIAEINRDFKRTDTKQVKRNKTEYKITHPSISQKIKDFYKNDENVKVVGADTRYGRGGSSGGFSG